MITTSWNVFSTLKEKSKHNKYKLYEQGGPEEKYHLWGSLGERLQLSLGSTKERKFGIKSHYRGPIASDTCALLLLTCGEGRGNGVSVSTSSQQRCCF